MRTKPCTWTCKNFPCTTALKRCSIAVSCSQVETVVGVHNAASSAINITALAGSLNNAKAFSQHFQNFTAQVRHGLLLWHLLHGMLSALPCKFLARHGWGPGLHDTCMTVCLPTINILYVLYAQPQSLLLCSGISCTGSAFAASGIPAGPLLRMCGATE